MQKVVICVRNYGDATELFHGVGDYSGKTSLARFRAVLRTGWGGERGGEGGGANV